MMHRNVSCSICFVLVLGLGCNTPEGKAPEPAPAETIPALEDPTPARTSPAPVSPAPAEKKEPVDLDKDPHLVGWWKFDESSGTAAMDSSKHGHNGALKGGLSFDQDSVPGRVGKALKFGGGEEKYVEITGYKGIAGTGPRTVVAWVKTRHTDGHIVSWGQEEGGKMFIFGFIRSGFGVTPQGGYLYGNSRFGEETWRHLAAVVEEAEIPNLHDDVKLYMNGEPEEIHDIGLLDLWPIDNASDLDVRIGLEINGLVDEVRIYDRALSGDEIKALYEASGESEEK